MALTTEHIGAGLMAIGVVIFAGMLTIRLFSSSGDWPLLLPIVIIGVVISYVGFALVLADNSRRARSCECSCQEQRIVETIDNAAHVMQRAMQELNQLRRLRGVA